MREPAKQTSLELLYGPTREKARSWLAQANAEFPQFDFRVLETRRTRDRQAWLFGQGRSMAQCQAVGIGAGYANPSGKTVTWTMDSMHRYDVALDFVIVRVNQPGPEDDTLDWNAAPYLAVLAKVPPERYGLRSLARIGDFGHLEDLNALSLIRRRLVALR